MAVLPRACLLQLLLSVSVTASAQVPTSRPVEPAATTGDTSSPRPQGARPAGAGGDQDLDSDDYTYTETVVVTATLTRQKVADVPASVSVLTADDLQRLAGRNLEDGLRNLPGLEIAKMSGMAARGNSQLLLRGVPGSRRTLLLVDGMPANDLGFGTLAALDLVPVHGLSRVEVVRGPFSSLYGANAFSGVVNVLTEPGRGRVTVEPFAAAGNAGYYQIGLRSQGGGDRVSYSVTADRRRIDNVYGRRDQAAFAPDETGTGLVASRVPVVNHDYDDLRLFGRVDTRLGSRVSLTILPRIARHEVGLGLTPRLPTPAESFSQGLSLDLGTVLNVGTVRGWSWQLRQGVRQGSSSLYQESFTTTPVTQRITIRPGPVPVTTATRIEFPYAALTRSDSDYTTIFVEPAVTRRLSDKHTLTAGASYAHDWGRFSPHAITDRTNVLGSDAMLASIAASMEGGMRARGAPDPSVSLTRDDPVGDVFPKTSGRVASVQNAGIFLQDEWTAGSRLRVIAGARLDKHSSFGVVGSPRAGLVFASDPRTSLRFSVGRAYRAPSLSELFGSVVFHGPLPGLPNPDLRPEFITAVDAGMSRIIGRTGWVEAAVFHNTMTDLITLRLLPSGDRLDWVNVARSRSTGLELTLSGRAPDWLSLSAHYGYTSTRDLDLGRPLPQVPAHRLYLSASGARAFGRVVAGGSLTWRWYDERVQEFRGVLASLHAYSRTDAALSLSWGRRGRIGIAAHNLFHQTYQESAVNLAPGRLLWANAAITF